MSAGALTAVDAEHLTTCLAGGGVAVFPADTVYGLGCDPNSEPAVRRLYQLKRRPPDRPAAVMLFDLDLALAALPELAPSEVAALRALLPGPLTVLLPNRDRRFPLACGPDPATLGLRVPALPARMAALAAVGRPLLQSSANLSGGREARTLQEVPQALRTGADLVLDGGELPGLASTVLDLRHYASASHWEVVRPGPLQRAELERRLARAGECVDGRHRDSS